MDCTNKNCPAYAKCLAPYRGSRCKATRATYGLGDPITNYDRIRAMSVEEMAEWLDRLITHCNDGPCFNCFMQEACLTSVLDWLKKEEET